MKKLLFIALAFFAIGFTSCKKDWTCECKDPTSGEVFSYQINDARKPEASLACDVYKVADIDCSLK